MTSEDNKGHIRSSENFKIIFLCDIFFVLTTNLLNTFQEFFIKSKYELKGYSRSYKTSIMPNSFEHSLLWADIDENLYEC